MPWMAPLPHTYEEALFRARQEAYQRFFALVVHASFRKKGSEPRWVNLADPNRFVVGRWSWPWSTFLYGEAKGRRKGNKRSRAFWGKLGMLLPFDQLRRDLVSVRGWLLLQDPETQRVVLCLNDKELNETYHPDLQQAWVKYDPLGKELVYLGNDPTTADVHVIDPWVLVVGKEGRVMRSTFNIVPFKRP